MHNNRKKIKKEYRIQNLTEMIYICNLLEIMMLKKFRILSSVFKKSEITNPQSPIPQSLAAPSLRPDVRTGQLGSPTLYTYQNSKSKIQTIIHKAAIRNHQSEIINPKSEIQ